MVSFQFIKVLQILPPHNSVSQFGYSLSKPVYSCSLNTSAGLECLNSTTPDDHTRDLGVSCESEAAPELRSGE